MRSKDAAKAPLDADMTGKVAVVTGATGGIGKEIARGLARLGASVVIGARTRERGEAARAEILGGPGSGDVTVMTLDVADQSSIRAFSAGFGKRHGRLDVLVNNAGAWFTDRRLSPDGYELTFATNVLGPHLLTELLLDALRAAGPARVVNVVSSMAGNYDSTDLQFTRRRFDGAKAYSQSKQALCMLTWGLAERLGGSGVTANAAAPGFVRTDFNRNARGFRVAMIGVFARLLAVDPAAGADTPLWAGVVPELDAVTGRYLEGRAEKPARFTEPGPIADLERQCRQLEAAASRPSPDPRR